MSWLPLDLLWFHFGRRWKQLIIAWQGWGSTVSPQPVLVEAGVRLQLLLVFSKLEQLLLKSFVFLGFPFPDYLLARASFSWGFLFVILAHCFQLLQFLVWDPWVRMKVQEIHAIPQVLRSLDGLSCLHFQGVLMLVLYTISRVFFVLNKRNREKYVYCIIHKLSLETEFLFQFTCIFLFHIIVLYFFYENEICNSQKNVTWKIK